MEDKKENKAPTDPNLSLNPDGTATFSMREEGDSTGHTYAGVFVFKCFLTPIDQLAAGKLYRELLGSDLNNASEMERFLSFAISTLKYRIVKAPSFWKTDSMIEGNVPDVNIITVVLDRAINAESLYKEQLAKRKADALQKALEATQAIQDALKPRPEKTE